MLVSEKVLDALKRVGLNLYERKLWVALLARGTSTAGELSEMAKVPRSRTYDILQSLADKGFILLRPGKPLRFVALDPEEALERAKRRLEEKFLEKVEKLNEIKRSEVMKELKRLFKQGVKLVEPEELTGTIKGKELIYQQLASMIKSATKEINILTDPQGILDLYSHVFSSLKKAKERGVEVRVATLIDERIRDTLKILGNVAEVKKVKKEELPISGKIFMVDGKEMLISLTDSKVHSSQELAIWSKSDHTTQNLLKPMFELVWKKSKEV